MGLVWVWHEPIEYPRRIVAQDHSHDFTYTHMPSQTNRLRDCRANTTIILWQTRPIYGEHSPQS